MVRWDRLFKHANSFPISCRKRVFQLIELRGNLIWLISWPVEIMMDWLSVEACSPRP